MQNQDYPGIHLTTISKILRMPVNQKMPPYWPNHKELEVFFQQIQKLMWVHTGLDITTIDLQKKDKDFFFCFNCYFRDWNISTLNFKMLFKVEEMLVDPSFLVPKTLAWMRQELYVASDQMQEKEIEDGDRICEELTKAEERIKIWKANQELP